MARTGLFRARSLLRALSARLPPACLFVCAVCAVCAVGAVGGAAGCSSSSTDPVVVPSGGAGDGTGGAGTGGGDGDGGGDGALPPRRPSVPCAKGDVTAPIAVFDPNPAATIGQACGLGNVLDPDDVVTGLDWTGASTGKIDGRDVGGCVGVEFGEGIAISSVIMRMRPEKAACGHACTEGVAHGCDEPDDWGVHIFVGKSATSLEFLQALNLTERAFFEYRVSVNEVEKARFAVVCRKPGHAVSDDVVIDTIAALCH